MRFARCLILSAVLAAAAAAQSKVRAELKPAAERKAAPEFELRDAAGKTAKLQDYKGKVVLLDFWATWCTGCKEEMPWFETFQRKFGAKRFAVVGVSVDEGGWAVLKPFLAKNPVGYRIVLGNDEMMRRYGLGSLPDTFLIDQQGRVAAAYLGVLVDRDNVEANVKALLAER